MKAIGTLIIATWLAKGGCSLAGKSHLNEISRHSSPEGHWAIVQFSLDNGPTSHPGVLVRLTPPVGQTGVENQRTILAYVGYHPAQVRWISEDEIILTGTRTDSFKFIDQMVVAWGKRSIVSLKKGRANEGECHLGAGSPGCAEPWSAVRGWMTNGHSRRSSGI